MRRMGIIKDVVKRNRSKLHEIAEKNTVRNSNGLPVASKNDPCREEDKLTEQIVMSGLRY